MTIKIFKDLKHFTLTSILTKENVDLVKKYRPAALKIKDADGNDIFGVSYVEGKHCASANGITFGSESSDSGALMVIGDIPAVLPDGCKTPTDYVADIVGAALEHITALEETIPEVAAEIKAKRAEVIEGIVEV
jgi:hypothetical protein